MRLLAVIGVITVLAVGCSSALTGVRIDPPARLVRDDSSPIQFQECVAQSFEPKYQRGGVKCVVRGARNFGYVIYFAVPERPGTQRLARPQVEFQLPPPLNVAFGNLQVMSRLHFTFGDGSRWVGSQQVCTVGGPATLAFLAGLPTSYIRQEIAAGSQQARLMVQATVDTPDGRHTHVIEKVL